MEWCIKNDPCEISACETSPSKEKYCDTKNSSDAGIKAVANDCDVSCVTDKCINPHHFYHAFEVDYTKVPQCTVKQFVLRGYPIPHMPRRYYLKTLWTPNNETLNVWTHLAPGLYFLYMLYNYFQVIDVFEEWPILVTIVSALVVTFCSSIAHMFHSRSELDHCCWLLFDYFGIICYSFGSTVSHFFACTEINFYSRIGYWNLAILTFHCCIVYYFMCITKIPNTLSATSLGNTIRISGLAYGYIYGILPVLYRYAQSDMETPAMYYHIISILFMAISPCLYACNTPQCYLPGRFDIVGHSHQMFHISSALMIYYDILAVYNDVTSPDGHWVKLKEQPDHPSLSEVGAFAMVLVVWCVVIGVFVGKTIHKTCCECKTSHANNHRTDEDVIKVKMQ